MPALKPCAPIYRMQSTGSFDALDIPLTGDPSFQIGNTNWLSIQLSCLASFTWSSGI